MRTARAPGKVNLFLEVLGRRDDGYHELETLIVPIRLADSINLEPTPPTTDRRPGEICLSVSTCFPHSGAVTDRRIPAGRENLVVKALELLQARSGCQQGARLKLIKRVPMAAGLGGGSSDAAAALHLANRAWGIDWPTRLLAALAAEIGSDVPFFLSGGPAICRGRGERVEPIPRFRPLHLVLVKPPEELKTADVYREYSRSSGESSSPKRCSVDSLADRLATVRWDDLARSLHNGLQTAAARLSPWVERLRTIFQQLDCPAHLLCGSGSAYFGVCRHAQHARRLTNILRTRQLGLVYATSSCP